MTLVLHYSLSKAAELFFPDTGVTASSLRTEIKRGNLPATKVGAKVVVSAADIEAMLERKKCRSAKDHASGSTQGMPAGSRPGLSETARKQRARDAALTTSKEPPARSKPISPKGTGRPKAQVIRPKFS